MNSVDIKMHGTTIKKLKFGIPFRPIRSQLGCVHLWLWLLLLAIKLVYCCANCATELFILNQHFIFVFILLHHSRRNTCPKSISIWDLKVTDFIHFNCSNTALRVTWDRGRFSVVFAVHLSLWQVESGRGVVVMNRVPLLEFEPNNWRILYYTFN